MKNEKLRISNVLLLSVVAASSLYAQGPDFSGTWRLDEAKSQVVATAGIIGLISAGAPHTLHITQPANGTIVVESQVNEGHSRIYKPGRESSTPAGQGGAVTMTAKWAGKTLVSEGALKAPNGDTTPVREVVSLSDDGKMLMMEVVTTPVGQTEKASSKLVFTKITDVGPCEKWPTPCKRFP
jgi:hypothetical protein